VFEDGRLKSFIQYFVLLVDGLEVTQIVNRVGLKSIQAIFCHLIPLRLGQTFIQHLEVTFLFGCI
jgi:hypothetical protein